MIDLRIKDILKEKGITQIELATKIGKKPQYINSIVNGGTGASLNTLKEIAEALDVPLSSLFADYKTSSLSCPHCGKDLHINIV